MQCITLGIIGALLPFCPAPQDKHGWGLRVHRLTNNSPLLAGEQFDRRYYTLTLINFSDKPQWHDPFVVAMRTKDLDINVVDPDGKGIWRGESFAHKRDPFTEQMKLAPGKSTSIDLRLGGRILGKSGRYTVEAEFKIDGKKVSSPPVSFEVLDAKAETILTTQSIPLAEEMLNVPADARVRPVIQQIHVRESTLLIYRRYSGPRDGGGISVTYPTVRLAELPGKVEAKFEGVHGSGNPLTIAREIPSRSPTRMPSRRQVRLNSSSTRSMACPGRPKKSDCVRSASNAPSLDQARVKVP